MHDKRYFGGICAPPYTSRARHKAAIVHGTGTRHATMKRGSSRTSRFTLNVDVKKPAFSMMKFAGPVGSGMISLGASIDPQHCEHPAK
jgi:hypothetical protein